MIQCDLLFASHPAPRSWIQRNVEQQGKLPYSKQSQLKEKVVFEDR